MDRRTEIIAIQFCADRPFLAHHHVRRPRHDDGVLHRPLHDREPGPDEDPVRLCRLGRHARHGGGRAHLHLHRGPHRATPDRDLERHCLRHPDHGDRARHQSLATRRHALSRRYCDRRHAPHRLGAQHRIRAQARARDHHHRHHDGLQPRQRDFGPAHQLGRARSGQGRPGLWLGRRLSVRRRRHAGLSHWLLPSGFRNRCASSSPRDSSPKWW